MITSFYPVLMSKDVAGSAAFFRTHLSFQTTFESDWYISLRRQQWELAILDAMHPTIPEAFRGATASGVLLNLEVPDVDDVCDRLIAEGLTPVMPVRSEDFGQRHAIFAGPDSVLIDIITSIPPVGDFASQFTPAALDEPDALDDANRRRL